MLKHKPEKLMGGVSSAKHSQTSEDYLGRAEVPDQWNEQEQ